jgi:D-amino-acid dehydrogenase
MKNDILIIGGGVVGMSCAYELSARGAKVTLIDRGEPGFGCSYGNAGWITPCFAMPLPMPGMMIKSLKWMTNPDGPLYIQPKPSVLLFRWLTRFLFSMNQRQALRSVAALTEISKYSIDAYAKLDQALPNRIGFERRGLLMVGQGTDGVKAAKHEMDLVAEHGIPGRLLDERGVRELEPALTGPLQGGVYFPEEAHAEPLQVVQALRDGAIANGATILPRTEVFDFHFSEGAPGARRITGIRTTRGDMTADQFVLATGSWSVPIAKRLGIRVPVLGGKGYSIIVKPFSPAPKIPLMLLEKKIAVTPRKDTIRLAGTLELVDRDESITPRRVDAILKGSREFMNVPAISELTPSITEVWRGLRPCTPDGVPIVGYPKQYSNLLLLTGHQMLGLQSAPGTARLAADLLLGTAPAFDPAPFRATRF